MRCGSMTSTWQDSAIVVDVSQRHPVLSRRAGSSAFMAAYWPEGVLAIALKAEAEIAAGWSPSTESRPPPDQGEAPMLRTHLGCGTLCALLLACGILQNVQAEEASEDLQRSCAALCRGNERRDTRSRG